MAASLLGDAAARVLIPTYSQLSNDIPRARAAFLRTLSVALPVYLCAGALGALYVSSIVQVVLGPAWIEAIEPMTFLFAALPFRSATATRRAHRMVCNTSCTSRWPS